MRTVGAEKPSISLDSDLAADVRAAANAEGVSVSTWLAHAAEARARQVRLAEALEAFDERFGVTSETEARRLVAEARERSLVSRPAREVA